MRKLVNYLKPYIVPLLITVGLLFGQATADLNLPNYMSKIVNVGIQQGGIEHASPDAISKEGLEFIAFFGSEEQNMLLSQSYQLISPNDATSSQKKHYPLLEEKEIYLLKDVTAEQRGELDLTFGNASWTFISLMQKMQDSGAMQKPEGDEEFDASNMDVAKVYQMLPMLQRLPENMLEEAQAESANTSDLMKTQTGTAFAQSFYRELHVDLSGVQQSYILKIGALMLLIALAGGVATIMVGLLSARIAAGIARSLRSDVFKKVSHFSHEEFDRFGAASLITRSTNDVTQVQMLLMMGIRMICYAPIMGIGGTFMALQKSTSMSWIIALACVLLIGIIIVVFSFAMPKFKKMQKLIDRVNLVARENLDGLMVVRAFGTQKFEKERFEEANDDLTQNQLFVNRVMVFMMPAMMLIMNCVTLLIVWVGSHQVGEGLMQVGDMMAFMQYAMQIIMSFLMISMMFIMVPRAAVSGDRIAEVLYTKPVIFDSKETKPFQKEKAGVVEFKGVNFRYHGAEEDVLHEINFTAKPGQTTAFIGSTGSGKSTLVNLIPRFYDVTDGQILVDGTDVREVSQQELRDKIGYVPQKGVLLSGTIASNLRYAKEDATEEEMQKAAEVAQATEFILQTENGLEREIAQSGGNVSGGQKQRISIARALVKKPEIYIFDDSFSALDFKTDAALRRALKNYTGESTVLIVAQRVSTIMNADQIIVLDEGKIVGIGTHRELLKSCPQYIEIASSQLSKEELE